MGGPRRRSGARIERAVAKAAERQHTVIHDDRPGNAEIYRDELGYSAQDLVVLRASGVI